VAGDIALTVDVRAAIRIPGTTPQIDAVGLLDWNFVGFLVGTGNGLLVGATGAFKGLCVILLEGFAEGFLVGFLVGFRVGFLVGLLEGLRLDGADDARFTGFNVFKMGNTSSLE